MSGAAGCCGRERLHQRAPAARGTARSDHRALLCDAAFEIVLSPAIVDEVSQALAYPKLRRLIRGIAVPALWFEDIVLLADLVTDVRLPSGVCADSDDDKYLAAAIEGRATFVVTGDRQLLALIEHDGVRMITPRGFLDLLGA